jgi:prophage antirepressor-like protein
LFKAKDIGDLLEMRNIREVIKNFNEKQRCEVSLTDAIGRQQNTTFLTEKGLYKVLMRSRKPIAEEFQDWVCELIKHIRLNSNNQLQNKIKELEFYKEPPTLYIIKFHLTFYMGVLI